MLDSKYWNERERQVRKIVLDYLSKGYPNIGNVHVTTFSMVFKSYTEFNILIEPHLSNNEYFEYKQKYFRKIRKDVYNLCRYILGKDESVNNILLTVSENEG